MSICGGVNVATLVGDESLHGARALGALHGLRYLPGDARDVEAAAMANGLNDLAMVLHENNLKSLVLHKLLPLVELFDNPKDCEAVASHNHALAFAQHGPTALVLVGKKFLDFLGDGVSFLLVHFGEEQALYGGPEPPKYA